MTDKQPPVVYTADPRRWGVLLIYAAASFMAVMVWNILVREARRHHALLSPRV
jgi:hypothetical protein